MDTWEKDLCPLCARVEKLEVILGVAKVTLGVILGDPQGDFRGGPGDWEVSKGEVNLEWCGFEQLSHTGFLMRKCFCHSNRGLLQIKEIIRLL